MSPVVWNAWSDDFGKSFAKLAKGPLPYRPSRSSSRSSCTGSVVKLHANAT